MVPDRCDPQKFLQPSPPSPTRGVIHPVQGEPQLKDGLECDADVCVEWQKYQLTNPADLTQGQHGDGRDYKA
jgi:hypothetical protein